MDCGCDMRFGLIYAIYSILILISFDKNIKEQVECSFLPAG